VVKDFAIRTTEDALLHTHVILAAAAVEPQWLGDNGTILPDLRVISASSLN
jgi:hypothetical protein